MIRTAALCLAIASTPANACLDRTMDDLINSFIVAGLTEGEDWDITPISDGMEATCYSCADDRSFLLFAMPHNASSLEAAMRDMDAGRADFCRTIDVDRTGRCLSSEVANQFDMPGRVRVAEMHGNIILSNEWACGGWVFYAQVVASERTAEVESIAQNLRWMMRYLTRFW